MPVHNSTRATAVAEANRPSAYRETVNITESITESEIQSLLDALGDPDCHRILETVSDDALTVKEVAEACELSISSAYRKLDRLTGGQLVEKRTRMHTDGHHASEYIRQVDDIVLNLNDGGNLQIRVSFQESVGPHPQDSN